MAALPRPEATAGQHGVANAALAHAAIADEVVLDKASQIEPLVHLRAEGGRGGLGEEKTCDLTSDLTADCVRA